jgi:malate synthase
MEDVATAEISRSQLWQWRRNRSETVEGDVVDTMLILKLEAEELAKLGGPGEGRLGTAAELLYGLVMSDDFADFLTLEAYKRLA